MEKIRVKALCNLNWVKEGTEFDINPNVLPYFKGKVEVIGAGKKRGEEPTVEKKETKKTKNKAILKNKNTK